MKNETKHSEAGMRYAAAYAAHYTEKDLHGALDLYKGVMSDHPDTREARYSRSQIHNIVKSVVPKKELFDAQVNLALAHFEPRD